MSGPPPTQEQIEVRNLEPEFRAHGFLDPSTHIIIEHAHSEMADWFALANDLDRLAQSFYVDCTALLTGRSAHEPICMGIQLMPRALAAFRGSVTLLERAMTIEAKTLTRTIFETAFWIGYLQTKGNEAAEQLRHETLKSEIAIMRAFLTAMPDMHDEQKAQVRARIREMEPLRDALPQPPTTEEMAWLGGFGSACIQYRMLSNRAAHASLKSTLVCLGRDRDGQFTGHEIGPDFDGAGEAMKLACFGHLHAVEGLRRLTGRPDIDAEFAKLIGRYYALPPHEQSQTAGQSGHVPPSSRPSRPRGTGTDRTSPQGVSSCPASRADFESQTH